jgi:ATPase subunit of ABC transporter with duplicated ATPase domains
MNNGLETYISYLTNLFPYRFPKITCTWGEPLITLLDVGHGFDLKASSSKDEPEQSNDAVVDIGNELKIVKKNGFLFDCVDVCIEEGSKNCILGPMASGKSSLLKILAKRLDPVEGSVHHAAGIRVGYFDPDVVDAIISSVSSSTTALDYLRAQYPSKTEQDLRSHLKAFGVSSTIQEKTPICYLSGGEKFRFVLASIMMEVPPILIMDNPTSNLDVDSVQAMIYGLRQWNGTLVMVSQDFHFLRNLDVKCAVITPEEGKLRRVEGGIDSYLKFFKI